MESLDDRVEEIGNNSRYGERDQNGLKISEDVTREPYESDEQRRQNQNGEAGDCLPKRALLKFAGESTIILHKA